MPVKWYGDDILNRLRPAMMRGVVKGVETVRSAAIQSIQSGPKTGRIYRRGSVIHQASAPGQSPASDTGRLVNSIVTSYQPETLSGTVQAGTEYAPYLEFGTATIEPRPFMRPALLNNAENILEAIANEIRAALA
jgi:HK97 gp10 family phage protein